MSSPHDGSCAAAQPTSTVRRRHKTIESDAPVNTIAQQVGYSSQYTFTHAFKRQYGSPPGSYRHHAG
ncbi:helix-turn-helix domain-containing protein [Nonomuraea aurantiaca]|uniref:helix-turn-helix domain-containing protein n=1 Tax=Nonomuraea aurantiaca TaxID=2878562 RepID=UPI001CD96745|nr:helix-turn-helix domain-containing protein [Nonomuraea aurantiaca]MCA2228253.1 helix-turn-helix domain-containing protein [Nonomuraea aurantiaca]